MTLWDELYFEATLHGLKSELKKFVNFLKSGELDDFFEITSEKTGSLFCITPYSQCLRECVARRRCLITSHAWID